MNASLIISILLTPRLLPFVMTSWFCFTNWLILSLPTLIFFSIFGSSGYVLNSAGKDSSWQIANGYLALIFNWSSLWYPIALHWVTTTSLSLKISFSFTTISKKFLSSFLFSNTFSCSTYLYFKSRAANSSHRSWNWTSLSSYSSLMFSISCT